MLLASFVSSFRWPGMVFAMCGATFINAGAQSSDYVMTRFAGAEHTNVDGPVETARFDFPAALALDAKGNLLVADSGNHTLRVITPAGMVATLAGSPGLSGSQDGIGSEARLNAPERLAIDADGNAYVASSAGQTVRKITPEGVVTTVVTDTELARTSLYGLALDRARNLYLALEWPGVIRKKTAAGVMTTIAGSYGQNEVGTVYPEILPQPRTIAMDASDTLHVIRGSSEILRLSAAGVATSIRTTGPSYFQAEGMVVSASGDIFIADTYSHRILKVTSTGVATTFAGGTPGNRAGVGTAANLLDPRGIAAGPDGTLFVAQGYLDSILKITPAAEVTTLAGTFFRVQDGAAEMATFREPWALAMHPNGDLIVLDGSHPVVRKIDSDRRVSTVAGSASGSGGADGMGAAATFTRPRGVAADQEGNLYITDQSNGTVRKIASDGTVTTIAGVAGATYVVDGSIAVARFGVPGAITRDAAGNLYVAEPTSIRKIAPTGDVTTVAGAEGPYSGSTDGIGTAARFGPISGLAVNNDGILYVVDRGSNTIRQITPTGVVTTLAGQQLDVRRVDGQGTEARFFLVGCVTLDGAGNLYVGESDAVRKVTPAGAVTTIWSRERSGGITPSFDAIAIDAAGNIYLSDPLTRSILKLAKDEPAPHIGTQPLSRAVSGGTDLTVAVAATGSPAPALQWHRNGVEVSGATTATLTISGIQPADTGLYRAVARNSAGSAASKVAIAGLATTHKVIGSGRELEPRDIRHPNGNVLDQVLLEGAAAAITADHSPDPALNQITRISFIDLDDDIVQVEFGGPGTLSLVLENPSGPAVPTKYNQATTYMKGHAGIVITGATERTNVSVFSVGRRTAVNQGLFYDSATYDGVADIAYLAIISANGRFGGVRTANASYYATRGVTGLYAPGVVFEGPVFIGNISAFDEATPVIQAAGAADVRITGGDLSQANGAPVEVDGMRQLQFTAGVDSHGNGLSAKSNRAVLMRHRADVTAQLVTPSN